MDARAPNPDGLLRGTPRARKKSKVMFDLNLSVCFVLSHCRQSRNATSVAAAATSTSGGRWMMMEVVLFADIETSAVARTLASSNSFFLNA